MKMCFNLPGVLHQHMERVFTGNAGGRATAFFFSFEHFLVDKASIQAVSHLLSVSFFISYLSEVFLAPGCSGRCYSVPLLLNCHHCSELRSPRAGKRKQGTGPCHQDIHHLQQDKECLCIFASHVVARHLST